MENIINAYRANIKKLPVSAAVYETMRTAIIFNKLPFNYRIKEEEFAKLLHVSRTPVREAINILMNRGLIVSDMKNGFVVKGFTTNEANDIAKYASTLRREAAGLTARAATTEQIIILEKNMITNEKIQQLKPVGEHDELYQIFQRFNLLVAKFSNNKYLYFESERMQEKLLLMHYYYPEEIKNDHPVEKFAIQNMKVFEAIMMHDSAKARRAIEEYDVQIYNVTRHMYNLRKDYK